MKLTEILKKIKSRKKKKYIVYEKENMKISKFIADQKKDK